MPELFTLPQQRTVLLTGGRQVGTDPALTAGSGPCTILNLNSAQLPPITVKHSSETKGKLRPQSNTEKLDSTLIITICV